MTTGYKFEDYEIHISNSNNHPGKFVAFIEEFFNVATIINDKSEAAEKLRPMFEKEIDRLHSNGPRISPPGSGKAKITFAPSDKIEKLRPFIDEFWNKILGTSFSTSFVSNDSYFRDWLHYVNGDKEELIRRILNIYNVDISAMYDRPIHEILSTIKK